jgi:AAA family ATP:ADP antiporter
MSEGTIMDKTPTVKMSPSERRAITVAFVCHFVLMASYYILRPVRDTVATIVGVGKLQQLFTATFVGTLILALLYAAITSRVRLSRVLPGVFWFSALNVGGFALLFHVMPENRELGAAYYVWFSVVNLFMVSVFWSLMVDVFSATQATRWFALIAAGGALGAIAGPLVTRLLVQAIGLGGLMIVAACGFALVIVLVHLLIQLKPQLQSDADMQITGLDHALHGSMFDGFRKMLKSSYFLNQAAFMLLMTWVNTIAYFCQTDLVSRTYSAVANRAQAIADIDLVVNVGTAAVLLLGLGRFMRRFGVTASLVLNPLLMVAGFVAAALSPTLLTIQLLQITRRIAQYAVARPSREVCFTVVEQSSKYKAKSIIDTVVYRLGDVSSAWIQTELTSLGFGLESTLLTGASASVVWGTVAIALGHRYNDVRLNQNSKANAFGDNRVLSLTQ